MYIDPNRWSDIFLYIAVSQRCHVEKGGFQSKEKFFQKIRLCFVLIPANLELQDIVALIGLYN